MIQSIDPVTLVSLHQQNLLEEAEQARLAALLPPKTSGLRHDIALACYRLATWLDAPVEYVQLPESGVDDWVGARGSV